VLFGGWIEMDGALALEVVAGAVVVVKGVGATEPNRDDVIMKC